MSKLKRAYSAADAFHLLLKKAAHAGAISRSFLWAALLFSAVGGITPPAHSQQIQRDVRIIVPAPPGGSYDNLARVMARYLTEKIGKTVLVENRGGGAQFLALQALAQAPADGHAFVIIANGVLATSPVLPGMAMPVHPDKDLVPVVNVVEVPAVLVASPETPYKTFQEFVSYARANPGKVNMATTGNASFQHLLGSRLAQVGGLKVEFIPYRGGQPAIQDVLAGNVQTFFGLLPETLGLIRSGKLKALAVASDRASAVLPEVPTMSSVFPGLEGSTRFGVVMKAGTSPEMVKFWNQKINDFLADPQERKELETRFMFQILGGSSEQMAQQIQADRLVWADVIRAAGIRAD